MAWQDDEVVSPAIKSRMDQDAAVPEDTQHDSSEYAAPVRPVAPAPSPVQIAPAPQQGPTPENPMGGAPGLPPPKPRPTLGTPMEAFGKTDPRADPRAAIVPLAETGLNMATGMGSSIVGGLAGAGRAMYGMLSGEGFEKGMKKGAEVSQGVQEAGTYQPRTAGGKAAAQAMNLPMQAASELAGKAGGAIGATVSPGAEAAMSSIGEAAVPIAATLMGGKSALDSAKTAAARTPEPVPGKDFSPLRDLTPEQMDRFQRMKAQGIEPTLGQVTRDPAQFKFEEQIARTKPGADLRTRELETNATLTKAVEKTDKMRAGQTTTENARETGHSVATALERNAKESADNFGALYKTAQVSGETKAIVNPKPLEKYLKQHEAEAIAVPELKAIKAKLDGLKKQAKDDGTGITVDDYESLYKAANRLSKPGDSSAHFMRDVKQQINNATDGIGGDLYRKARAARLEHSYEFEDRAAIARLIEKKPGSRTDYQTANEDVFNKTVVGSSLEELKDVTRSLLRADPKTHPESWQAVRNLQGQTIDYLMESATKGIALDEFDNPVFSPAGFRKGMREIGRDKLEHLLGPDALARLGDILKTSREVKTTPGRVSGSETTVNMAVMAERAARESAAKHLMTKVPGAGGLLEYFKTRKEAAATTASVKEALTPRMASPEDIAAGARAVNKQERQLRMGEAKDIAKGATPAAAAAQPKKKQKPVRIELNGTAN